METDRFSINDQYIAEKTECKYLGLILDSNLSFQSQTKKLQNMAQGIKTIDNIGQQLPALVLIASLPFLVLSNLDYAAILNSALKRTFYRSKFKSSAALRKSESFIGIEKRTKMKRVTYLYQYLTNKRQAFTNALSLPTANYRNQGIKQIIFDNHCSTASLQNVFFI